ncbi:hypothetical protein HK405_008823, partial [Cladochytrium tenue]
GPCPSCAYPLRWGDVIADLKQRLSASVADITASHGLEEDGVELEAPLVHPAMEPPQTKAAKQQRGALTRVAVREATKTACVPTTASSLLTDSSSQLNAVTRQIQPDFSSLVDLTFIVASGCHPADAVPAAKTTTTTPPRNLDSEPTLLDTPSTRLAGHVSVLSLDTLLKAPVPYPRRRDRGVHRRLFATNSINAQPSPPTTVPGNHVDEILPGCPRDVPAVIEIDDDEEDHDALPRVEEELRGYGRGGLANIGAELGHVVAQTVIVIDD